MPINVPATQVEDFTTRMDGASLDEGSTPMASLSSPMTGEVRLDYGISGSCFMYVRLINENGNQSNVPPTSDLGSGWTRRTNIYAYRARVTGSWMTFNVPDGYRLAHVHLGSTLNYTDRTISKFTVTGFSEGLVERVWYNEWIAEVYQGRDLIYKGPEPVEVEIEDLVGGEHVLSREVRCVGKELNPQHTGNMWMGITQWGLSKIPVGDTISVYIVVEDSDGNPVEELLNPDTYPNNGWSGPYNVPRHIQHPGSNYVEAGSVRGFGRLRLSSFGDFTDYYGEPAFGNSFELHLRDGERLTYMAVEYNTNSYPDNQLLPEFRVESTYFGPAWD